jgi:hypothetical protein
MIAAIILYVCLVGSWMLCHASHQEGGANEAAPNPP